MQNATYNFHRTIFKKEEVKLNILHFDVIRYHERTYLRESLDNMIKVKLTATRNLTSRRGVFTSEFAIADNNKTILKSRGELLCEDSNGRVVDTWKSGKERVKPDLSKTGIPCGAMKPLLFEIDPHRTDDSQLINSPKLIVDLL